MALTLSYTGFATDLARRIAGLLATSETRAPLDAMALFTAARANRAAASAPQAATPLPASTPCGGGGGRPSGGHSSYPSSSDPYSYPPRDTDPYRSLPRDMGPQGRERDRDHAIYHYGDLYRDGGGRGGGNAGGSNLW